MLNSNSGASRRALSSLRATLALFAEWQFWALAVLLVLGTILVAQLPLHALLNVGYEEGWWSDRPLIQGWNTGEPEHASATERSYRWTGEDSRVLLTGAGAQPLVATVEQLPATANPNAETGALHIGGNGFAVSQPLLSSGTAYVLVPAGAGDALHFQAPTFTPPGDPRVLGAPIATLRLSSLGGLQLPPAALWWSLGLLPLAWGTARRWCLGRGAALAGGLLLVALLLAALAGDRLRFALAGGPLLTAALWALLLGTLVVVAVERWAPRLGVRPSRELTRRIALLVFWLMLLRYGGRLYPESMIGDLGFHVNREIDVINGLVHLLSLHRGISFPYPSGVYILLAPLRLLPVDPYALVNWADALFGALGVLPIAYLTLRGLRDERITLLATATYACLAPAMMALWWSFLTHIFSQEALALLLAVLVGVWSRLDTRRGVVTLTAAIALVFFGHFGLFINISLLLGGLIVLLWWQHRGTDAARKVYGLLAALAIAEVLALGLFYSGYIDLIVEKLAAFSSGGMGAVQGGRAATSSAALLRSLWRDGLVAHYAIVGVPLAFVGGVLLWRRAPRSILAYAFWGTIAVASLQAAIPFLTSSTISTRWLSFCAWVVALGTGIVLDWLWRRGRIGQGAALAVLAWIGGSTLWLWVEALAFRIRPPEPF